MKAIVAMSGGVDSSVAAYLLQKQGYEVIGVSFELWDKRDIQSSNVCCSIETIRLAKAVADKLNIEHYSVDVRDAFYTKVVEEFCESYIAGTTPNPCIMCNKHIKFSFLIDKANELGADIVATGHYARVEEERRMSNSEFQTCLPAGKVTNYEGATQGPRFLLKKGPDPKKDQSYVLYVMTQEELAKTVFPLGEMKKEETRKIALDLGLATALRAESQEICFVGDDKYEDFIKKFSPESLRPGPIVDINGKVIGEHKGLAFYTIGQRKGLGIQSLDPHYVADIDRKRNAIVIGSRSDAMRITFKVRDLNWISINKLMNPMKAGVKIRSTMKEVPAIIHPEESIVRVECEEPQWAPAPGQSAVFYDHDVVIGGGIIY